MLFRLGVHQHHISGAREMFRNRFILHRVSHAEITLSILFPAVLNTLTQSHLEQTLWNLSLDLPSSRQAMPIPLPSRTPTHIPINHASPSQDPSQ